MDHQEVNYLPEPVYAVEDEEEEGEEQQEEDVQPRVALIVLFNEK